MSGPFWWYVTRASGIVTWVFLTASVIWGIILATDLFPAHRRPAWLLDLHRWFGGLTVSFLVVHVAALVADSYVHFDVVDLLLPFASEYKTGPVALGVVALWGVVAVQCTSLARKRVSKRVWKGVHRTSYVTFWLGSLHGTFSGSDVGNRLYLATSTLSAIAIVWATIYRVVGRSKTRGSQRTREAVST